MKKLILILLAAVGIAACNTEPSAESTTAPVFSKVTVTPETIGAEDKPTLKTTVSSRFGLKAVLVYYYVNDDPQTMKVAWQKLYTSTGQTEEMIEATMPALNGGTKVKLQIYAISAYDVVGVSEIIDYQVTGSTPEAPEQTPVSAPGNGTPAE